MFCCLTASTARALLCMANAEFGIQVIVEAVVACPKPEYCNLFPSGQQVVGVSLVVPWVLVPPLAVLLGLEDDLHLRVAGGYSLALLLCPPLPESQQPHCQAGCSEMVSIVDPKIQAPSETRNRTLALVAG